AHERRRIEGDDRSKSLREGRLELLDEILYAARRFERVCVRGERDRDARRLRAVVAADEAVVGRAELDARDVAELERRTVDAAADHDVAELLGRLQTTLRGDRRVELLPFERRGRAELSYGNLRVLRANRVRDV